MSHVQLCHDLGDLCRPDRSTIAMSPRLIRNLEGLSLQIFDFSRQLLSLQTTVFEPIEDTVNVIFFETLFAKMKLIRSRHDFQPKNTSEFCQYVD
ncbi:hypothetical protein CEXT_649341 [Caerostris extrusa]|uniref:Uncharacterized protein n=1 Tax=Caerostris extrusa TaxID=172846 RepID=A0AAV4Y1F2_CAEEX|nr:hypothetical protein CEXT_649341 [Caerostris extrusa]